MEKTFILGNSQSIQELGSSYSELPKAINEAEIHNWVLQLFSENEIEKVVIEIEERPLLSLQIGYHIRLSLEDLQRKTLVPILFISRLPLNSIILQVENYSQILATKGVYFSELDLQSNRADIQHLSGLSESEYLTKFLKIINIQADETIGRHSMANVWGAYAMDKASNAHALSTNSEFKKKLYFKYMSALKNINLLKTSLLKVVGHINVGGVNRIDARNRRILLIDDEADQGWKTVLEKVFRTSSGEDLVVINEKITDYDSLTPESKDIIQNNDFDLFLVDLRLNGFEEEEKMRTEDFSGMKVLKKIKSFNQGNQVIIFTASNKAWNLKALLDAGADGYYMKESPKYNFSKTFSEQNYEGFKVNVERCFQRDYLREVWACLSDAKSETANVAFVSDSDTALNITWELIKNDFLEFGFLTLYQCLESYANNVFQNNLATFINSIDGNHNEWVLTYNKDAKYGDYLSSGRSIQDKGIKPTALYKISCLLYSEYRKDDAFLKSFGKLNKLRNQIAHPEKTVHLTKGNLIEILQIIKEVRAY